MRVPCIRAFMQKPFGTRFVLASLAQDLNNGRTALHRDRDLQIDAHIIGTIAGMSADARPLVDRAQVECLNHRLEYEVTRRRCPPPLDSFTSLAPVGSISGRKRLR
jgi:hypothetical protein